MIPVEASCLRNGVSFGGSSPASIVTKDQKKKMENKFSEVLSSQNDQFNSQHCRTPYPDVVENPANRAWQLDDTIYALDRTSLMWTRSTYQGDSHVVLSHTVGKIQNQSQAVPA